MGCVGISFNGGGEEVIVVVVVVIVVLGWFVVAEVVGAVLYGYQQPRDNNISIR